MQTFGLIGRNIDYSFSRKYFNEKFLKNQWPEKQYVNFDIENIEQVSDIFAGLHSGYNVTIPYKEKIIPFLDDCSEEAKQIGAVNTIKIDGQGRKIGYNTDCYGFSESLKKILQPIHKKALILGNGGASKAVQFVLEQLEIPFHTVARNPGSGELHFDEVDAEMIRKHQIMIHTTPLGTFPDIERKPEIPYDALGPDHLLYDLIYNPEKTAFLLEGEKRGTAVKNGYEMLVLQAEKAWEIWNE